MSMSIPKKATSNTMERKTVQGLLVFFGFGLEITISSNMGPTSSRREQDVRGRFRYRGLCCRLRVRCLPRRPVRASDTKTGIRSYHNPYHQGKGESTKHLAAHQEQDEHGKESQTAGQDRSRKSLIDGLVDHVSKRFLSEQAVVLPDAIEDDDRVVHGITDQRE